MGMQVGFIGTGTMGHPMAANVVAAGHHVRVHDVSPGATSRLVELGAVDAASPAAAASGADVVLLSLPGPVEVRAAILAVGGVLDADPLPRMVVDLSTNSPGTVAELAERCAGRGVTFVDAPVSGGVAKAETGTLAVLVGATPESLEATRPVLEAIGRDVLHVGPCGAGTIAKIVNNQLFLAGAVAVQEAYVLGAALGMTPTDLHQVVAASSAAPYAKLAPLLLGRTFDDVIFRLDIAAKDLHLAVESADEAGVDVPLTRAAAEVYAAAADHGDAGLVFHATLRELERRAGFELPPLRRPDRSAS
jgi:3-hydroxyisobutyrate dehydrogenase-like beta-hydroxyacid dehydrogenase